MFTRASADLRGPSDCGRSLSRSVRTEDRDIQGDRFIPARSSMNFDVANYLLVGSRRGGDNMQQQPTSLSTEDHRNRLSEALMINTRRVLSFWWSEPTTDNFEQELYEGQGKRRKRRYISKSPDGCMVASAAGPFSYLNNIR
ncbi:hypothetical protein AAC387_Pa08g1248 [Persea americana]